MRSFPSLALLALALPLSACTIRLGQTEEPSGLELDGLADGYAVVTPISKYDGKILDFGIFSSRNREGEWVSLDIWPLGGVGIGFVGARIRILFFEIAGGVLGFPEEVPTSGAKETKPEKIEVKPEKEPVSDTKQE